MEDREEIIQDTSKVQDSVLLRVNWFGTSDITVRVVKGTRAYQLGRTQSTRGAHSIHLSWMKPLHEGT